jgi:hypothetical protein
MRHFLVALSLLTLGISFSFAQPPSSAPGLPDVSANAETKIFTGKVESVSLADPAQGTKSEIAAVDESGKRSVFLVKSTTTIYGSDWKAMVLEKINKDEKIKVKYITTKEGIQEAESVNLLK